MANFQYPISKFNLDVGHSHLEIGYWIFSFPLLPPASSPCIPVIGYSVFL
jgi:hypothetical protein